MANIFERKDRHVIPNWRSFDNTAKLGELNGSKGIDLHSSFKPDISDLVEDWAGTENIAKAGDILGVALLSNQRHHPMVKEIAKFVLSNSRDASKAILNAAKEVERQPSSLITETTFDEKSIEVFKESSRLLKIHQDIGNLKSKLIINPSNAINWVEISRLYSILGQQGKAERSMRNAISLANENRFVLRNASRFFTHTGDLEFAHDLIRRSALVKDDPWLLASEISIAALRGRTSRFAKRGIQIVESDNFHPFNISELASSLATLEWKNSAIKKSKKLFDKSLRNPNDNSLAQAEWAEQQDSALTSVNPSAFKIANSFEALARDSYQHRKWHESIEYAKQWFLDMPFSKGAVTFANEIAFSNLRDHNLAVEIAKTGLISHPNDPQLINNIIYSLCLQDKVDEAKPLFDKINIAEVRSNEVHQICLSATTGLYHFRIGEAEEGRLYYRNSMLLSKKLGDTYLNNLAFVNYCREEVLVDGPDLDLLIPRVGQIVKEYPGEEISVDASQVIALYNDKKR